MRICCPCVYVGSVNSICVARENQVLAVAPCFPSLSGGTKVFPRFVGAVLKEILKFSMVVSHRNTGLMDV